MQNDKFSKALDNFELIESKLKLDKRTVLGVPIWDNIRYPLFLEILSNLNLFENKIKIKKVSLIPKIIKLFKMFSYSRVKMFFFLFLIILLYVSHTIEKNLKMVFSPIFTLIRSLIY